MTVLIRRAGPAEKARSRELAVASKWHRRYDEERPRDWAAGLDLSREIWVAEEDGPALAWLALLPPWRGVCEL